ncbi:MAG: hypothetical protein LBB94_09445 [Clostridiales bacterium]|jgi:hypothetical protein|nr:hypothetical protein [Clostridiales bacterium]
MHFINGNINDLLRVTKEKKLVCYYREDVTPLEKLCIRYVSYNLWDGIDYVINASLTLDDVPTPENEKIKPFISFERFVQYHYQKNNVILFVDFNAFCYFLYKEQYNQKWNENNYDITKNRYMYDAYNAKKWAFVSDYARLDVLCQYGGVYIDVDVELLESLKLSRHCRILENKR